MFKIPFIFRNYNNIILAEGFELTILNLKNDKYNLLPLEQIQYLLKKKKITNLYILSRTTLYIEYTTNSNVYNFRAALSYKRY